MKKNKEKLEDKVLSKFHTFGNVDVIEKETVICLQLRNCSEDKLYDVDIFDFKHKEQQKIKYISLQTDYDQVLRWISSIDQKENGLNIDKIRVSAFCDYAKYTGRQLQSVLRVEYKAPNGDSTSTPKPLIIDPNQMQGTIVEMNLGGDKYLLYNRLNLQLSYLMPETTVSIYIYAKKK